MKKVISIMLALTLALSLMAGCSKDEVSNDNDVTKAETETETSNESEISEEEIKENEAKDPITFWIYEGVSIDGELLVEEIIDGFTKETGYEVNIIAIPKDDFGTKIAASIAIGEAPDLAYMDQPLVATYAADDILLDVTEYIESDESFSPSDYYVGAYETNKVGDKMYGLPLNQTTVAIFYNKDLVLNVPSTWAEWVAESKRIYEQSNGEIAAFEQMWGGGGGAWLFPAFVHNAGGQMVNEDATAAVFAEQGGIEAAELILDLYEYSPLEVRTSSNAFANGLAAFKMSGPWEISGLDDSGMNYGVMLMPTKEGHTHYSNIGGENIVGFKDGANPDGAWALMKYLTRSDVNSKFVQITGNYPANLDADIEEFISHPAYSVFFEQLKYAVARPRVANWLKINDEYIGTALDAILVEGADPSDTLMEAQDNANTIFGDKLD